MLIAQNARLSPLLNYHPIYKKDQFCHMWNNCGTKKPSIR